MKAPRRFWSVDPRTKIIPDKRAKIYERGMYCGDYELFDVDEDDEAARVQPAVRSGVEPIG